MLNVFEGSKSRIENTAADGQCDVTKVKRGTKRIGRSRFGVFTQAIKVEETNIGHVNGSKEEQGGTREAGDFIAIVDKA